MLASGPKYTMTETELKQALDESQGIKAKAMPPAETTTDEAPKRKPRAK